ncbi:hypothetical protein [Streptomyces sp. NPDC003998]
MDSRASALLSYDAVRAELPGLLPLLDDPDPTIRTRTAYLSAWFPEEAAAVLPRLLDRLRVEDSATVTATALVAVGLLGDVTLTSRISHHLDATEPLFRWAAATALARIGSSEGATGLGIDLTARDRRTRRGGGRHPEAGHRLQRRRHPGLHLSFPSAARRP